MLQDTGNPWDWFTYLFSGEDRKAIEEEINTQFQMPPTPDVTARQMAESEWAGDSFGTKVGKVASAESKGGQMPSFQQYMTPPKSDLPAPMMPDYKQQERQRLATSLWDLIGGGPR